MALSLEAMALGFRLRSDKRRKQRGDLPGATSQAATDTNSVRELNQ